MNAVSQYHYLRPRTDFGFAGFHVWLLLLALLATSPLSAGQYFQDFSAFTVGATNFSDGSQLFSTQPSSLASVQDATYKELQLTASGVLATSSAFSLPDLDPNKAVYAFSAKWNAAVYGNFPSAGDGFSFNFGQVTAGNVLTGAVEAGYGTGLCFSVQTAGATPGFYLKANGTVLASAPNDPTTQWGVNNATRHLFEVDWNYLTGMTVRVDGTTIFTNVPTPGITPLPGDHAVWAARSVNYSEYLRLDNIVMMTGGNLVTAPASSPYFTDANSYYLHPGSYAFDGNSSTYWLETAPTGYAGATINSPVAVYALTALHDNGGAVDDPQSWDLDGSNDGATWTALGTGSGYFLNSRETRCWMTANTNSFTDCRLNVTANNGGPYIKLFDVTLYRFQAQNGPPAASLTYLTPSVTPFGFIVQATIPTSFGNNVTVNWGTSAAYGSSATLKLNNNTGAQTLSFAPPRVDLAVPIHYQFVYQYDAGPGAYDITGPDAVVQPTGFQTIAYARPNLGYGSGFDISAYPPLPSASLSYTADSVAFFDSQNLGVLDLLTTGQSVALGNVIANFGSLIFLNSNPITSGTAFTTTKPAAKSSDTAGALWGGYNAIFNFDNDNYPAWTVGGDNSSYVFNVTSGGANYGLSLGLPVLANGSYVLNEYDPIYQLNLGNQHIAGPGRGVAADFDQDGFDDLLILDDNGGYGLYGLSSLYTYTPSAFLLHNIPNAGPSTMKVGVNTTPRLFAQVATTLPVPATDYGAGSTIAVGDVNNDGYPDLFIALKQPDGTFTARCYLNQQGQGFVPGPQVFTPGSLVPNFVGHILVYPSAVLADFNGDGNLDLLLAGWGDPSAPTTAIYYGDGTGHFTDSNMVLPQRNYASVAVGDLFNHGRNDIVLGGNVGDPETGSRGVNTLVLRNEGGSFTAFDWGMLPAVSMSGRNIALADVDNDGKLDIAAGDQEDTRAPGFWGGYPLTVYRNAMNIPTNAPPFAPTNLVSQVGSGTVTLHWGNASDDITPANLLTYNLRIGTITLGTDTVSPLANTTTGWRKVVAPGNRGHDFQCAYHLLAGTYHWSVQAIDGAFAGGAWATEGTFTVPAVPEAVADTVSRQAGRTLKIPFSTLLANDRAPAGPAVTVTAVDGVSAGGVPVQLVEGAVLYTPVDTFGADDSFTYTISDGTHTATATVSVTVQAAPETPTQNIVSSGVAAGGALTIKAAGIPGRGYVLQITGSLTSPVVWTNLGAAQVAPANGQMTFTDPAPASPRFYRVTRAAP